MTSIMVIDVESTGLAPETDRVVEIAAVKIEGSDEHGWRKSGDTAKAQLIYPGIPIPPEASAVHHIVDQDVASMPKLEDVIHGFAGSNIYAAHRASFDSAFLPALDSPWICTWKCALRLWPEAPGHGNQVLRYWLGMVEVQGLNRHHARMHRALPDALVTAALLLRMLETRKVETLLEWSGEPARLPFFTFGKHAMTPIADVPTGYLKWMSGQDFDEDVRFTVAMELERRRG